MKAQEIGANCGWRNRVGRAFPWTPVVLAVVAVMAAAAPAQAGAGVCVCNADIDGDGQVTFTDVTAVADCVLNNICNCPAQPNCDVNCDGVLDTTDIDAASCLFQSNNDPAACPDCQLPTCVDGQDCIDDLACADGVCDPLTRTCVCKCAPPGEDCFWTFCDGSTQVDFSTNPLPAGFFCGVDLPFAGVIELGGPFIGLGDTIVRRLDTACFTGIPQTVVIPTEMVQLSLESCNAISVSGCPIGSYSMRVSLDPTPGALNSGDMTITKEHPDGGTFSSNLNFDALFVPFEGGVQVGPGASVLVSLSNTGAPWRQDILLGSEVFCGENGFAPGWDIDPQGQHCCTPVCHDNPDGDHLHCVQPPKCPQCPTPPVVPCPAPDPTNDLCANLAATDCLLDPVTDEQCRPTAVTFDPLAGLRAVTCDCISPGDKCGPIDVSPDGDTVVCPGGCPAPNPPGLCEVHIDGNSTGGNSFPATAIPPGAVVTCDCPGGAPPPDPHITLQGTSATFGSDDVAPIPGDFFGPGSPPFVGPVNLVGGPTDTLGQRSGPIVCPGIGPCDPVSVELVQLDLVSAAPITVGASQWDVAVDLSPTGTPPLGTMDATLTHANGGTYDADIPFSPRFKFTEVGNPSNVKVLDFDLEGQAPIIINFVLVHWVIQLGPSLVGTIDAPNDGNFVPGVLETNPGDPNSQVVIQSLGLSKGGGIDHPVQNPPILCPLGFDDACQQFSLRDCAGTTDQVCLPRLAVIGSDGGAAVDACTCFDPGPGCGPIDVRFFGLASCPGDCPAPGPPCVVWLDDGTGPQSTHTPDFATGGLLPGTTLYCDCDEACPTTPCSTPSDCDDGDACTTDGCDATGCCTHVPLCTADADCDDGDACTTDTCGANGCCDNTPDCTTAADCDDGDACTTDTCDAATGCCDNTPDCTTAADCDDGDACTTDTCGANGCCDNTPDCTTAADCDDGDACTTDTCDAATGCCDNTPDCTSDAECADGDPCTIDTCDAATGCCDHADDPACGECVPNADQSACEPVVCPPSGRGTPADPCVVVDNGTGTVTLPPIGCPYLSPEEFHEIVGTLPAGTVIQMAAIHKDFICLRDDSPGCPPPGLCEQPGGNLDGHTDCFESKIELEVLIGSRLPHFTTMDAIVRVDTGPRNPGDAVQDFPTEMVQLQASLPGGDALFSSLSIIAGSANGLPPSTGHTTLTRLPGGNYNVDSFFDIVYEIDWVGAPGGLLDGHSGTDQGTLRMRTGTPVTDECQPRCVEYNTATGETKVIDCDCRGLDDCRPVVPGAAGVPCAGARDASRGPNGCVAVNVGGTVQLPPANCGYLSPDDLHKILDGLPPNVTLDIGMEHNEFFNSTRNPGGSLGGEVEEFDSILQLSVCGNDPDGGPLDGYTRLIIVPIHTIVHTAPRTPGDAVQTFASTMWEIQGELFGDPDFCTLKITGGDNFGLPSPGQTTLTRLGPAGSNFQVDSFFDLAYTIEYVGCPGSILDGTGGTTQATVRMGTGGGPLCEGNCPPGTVCVEDRQVDPATGVITLCCDCVAEELEACCQPFVSCYEATAADCAANGGTPQGAGTVCLGPVACCVDGTCVFIDEMCCDDIGGVSQGKGSDCDTDPLICEAGCEPDPSGQTCAGTCPDPVNEVCQAQCVTYDPLTGQSVITDCACSGTDECHMELGGTGIARGPGGDPCVVANQGGTIELPPIGCEYLTAGEVHEIITNNPNATFVLADPIHTPSLCENQDGAAGFPGCPPPGICEEPGGTLGGNVDCFDSVLQLTINGGGDNIPLSFSRTLVVPVLCQAHSGPRTPGDAVQSFPTSMHFLQGELFGDPDFCTFRVRGGGGFGMPSPGHTVATRLGPAGSSFQVDSFFDIVYEIEFEGCPGSVLEGLSGTTTGRLRMQTGSTPDCVGACPPGTVCNETKTVTPDGQLRLCCECVEWVGVDPVGVGDCGCAFDGATCSSDADCPDHCEGGTNADGLCTSDDGCPGGSCGAGDCCEGRESCVNDVCHRPKDRYLSIAPRVSRAGTPFAVAIDLPDGRRGWVSEPEAVDFLGIDPAMASWVVELGEAYYSDAWPGVVHLRGCVVQPNQAYEVLATTNFVDFGPPLAIGTGPAPEIGSYGDVVGTFDGIEWTGPNAVVNFQDVGAVVRKFLQDPTAPHTSQCDIDAQWANYHINFLDVSQVIRGFQVLPYPPSGWQFQALADCPLSKEEP